MVLRHLKVRLRLLGKSLDCLLHAGDPQHPWVTLSNETLPAVKLLDLC